MVAWCAAVFGDIADVAQLAEQPPRKWQVVGSNPTVGSIRSRGAEPGSGAARVAAPARRATPGAGPQPRVWARPARSAPAAAARSPRPAGPPATASDAHAAPASPRARASRSP